MRWGLVVLLLSACTSRYGAYFTIESDTEFDKIELYFGAPSATNQFATPVLGPQTGMVFDRKYDASDLATLAAPTKHTTYWVPASDVSDKLGAYVVVVATGSRFGVDVPVGIAEVFDFDVPHDAAHEYRLKLEPLPQEIDRWGARNECVAWRRPRGDVTQFVAVVTHDDHDCDSRVASLDCNDLCNGALCGDTLCAELGVCALGCSRDGLCAPSLCLPAETCFDIDCTSVPSIDSKLECAAVRAPHMDILVNSLEGFPCATEFTFDVGTPCNLPAIEAQVLSNPGVTYSIEPKGTACLLKMAAVANIMWGGVDYVLISFAPTTIGPRWSMAIGIAPSGSTCSSTTNYTLGIPMISACR